MPSLHSTFQLYPEHLLTFVLFKSGSTLGTREFEQSDLHFWKITLKNLQETNLSKLNKLGGYGHDLDEKYGWERG